MSHQPVIDGFEFASAGATQHGNLPLKEFSRLRDLLASDAGEVAYEVEGTRDERGQPSLRVSVRGALQLRCQRCLEGMWRGPQSPNRPARNRSQLLDVAMPEMRLLYCAFARP